MAAWKITHNYTTAFEALKFELENPIETFHLELKAKFDISQT